LSWNCDNQFKWYFNFEKLNSPHNNLNTWLLFCWLRIFNSIFNLRICHSFTISFELLAQFWRITKCLSCGNCPNAFQRETVGTISQAIITRAYRGRLLTDNLLLHSHFKEVLVFEMLPWLLNNVINALMVSYVSDTLT